MAVTECPKCGGKISDQAKNCVHCGCKLTACPDCGTLLAEGTENCPNCGRPLSSGEVPQANNATDEGKHKKITILKNACARVRRARKTENFISIAGVIILLFIACIAFVIYNNWKVGSGDPLTMLLNAQDVYDKVRMGIISAVCVGGIFSVIEQVVESYRDLLLSRWLRDNHVDPVKGVKEYLSLTKDEGEVDQEELVKGAFYCANPSKKALIYISFAASVVIRIALIFAVYYFFSEYIRVLMDEALTGIAIDTGEMFNNIVQPAVPALIVAGIGFALWLACEIIGNIVRSKWEKQNHIQEEQKSNK